MHVPRAIYLPALLFGTSLGPAVEPAFGADPALRYKLRPGLELKYESNSKMEHEAGFGATTSKASVWVTSQTATNQWQLALHFAMIQSGSYSNRPYASTNILVGLVQMADDGRLSHYRPEFHEDLLREFIVRMPADPTKARGGWVEDLGPGDTARLRLVSPVAGKGDEWVIERSEHGISRDVSASTSKSTVHFDDRRGVVTRIVTDEIYRLGTEVTNSVRCELQALSERSLEWIRQMGLEMDIAEKATAEAMRLSNEAEMTGAPRPITAMRQALREARAKVTLPPLSEYLDGELAGLQPAGDTGETEANPAESLAGKPAPDWIAKDLDGKEHTLSGYRGKVVLMDFWFRGCGWCIKAMPQLKELADHYRSKPVVLLGVNSDKELKDARFVADRLKLNYVNLMGKELTEKYEVTGFPTVTVIDRKGNVVGQHVGYSATLKEDLVKQVDALLGSE